LLFVAVFEAETNTKKDNFKFGVLHQLAKPVFFRYNLRYLRIPEICISGTYFLPYSRRIPYFLDWSVDKVRNNIVLGECLEMFESEKKGTDII